MRRKPMHAHLTTMVRGEVNVAGNLNYFVSHSHGASQRLMLICMTSTAAKLHRRMEWKCRDAMRQLHELIYDESFSAYGSR